MNKHGLTVGQQLWYVPSRRRGAPGYVTVHKVGRVWADLSNGKRISLDYLVADGGQFSPPGRAYISQEAYQEEAQKEALWSAFRQKVERQYSAPNGVTSEQILHAASALNITLIKEEE